jgi:hypothetical protein
MLRGGIAAAAFALAGLGLALATRSAHAIPPDCPGGTQPFVANFVAPTGTFPDLSGLDLPLPLDFTADISPGPPGSNVDLITINACIPVTPGQGGVAPVRTIPFTTPTPGGVTFFVTPTNTPAPTATQAPPAPTAAVPLAPTGATTGTGIRPPATGDAGLKADDRLDLKFAGTIFACILIALSGGLAIGASLQAAPRLTGVRAQGTSSDSGRPEDA